MSADGFVYLAHHDSTPGEGNKGEPICTANCTQDKVRWGLILG